MKDGVLFYPTDREVSRYAAFADAWRHAHRIREWFYPARADLSQALQLRRADLLAPAVRLARQAVGEALHALLIRAGGDLAGSEHPLDVLDEIQALDGPLAEPINKHRAALRALAGLAPDAGIENMDPERLTAALLAAARVVRCVGRSVGPDLEPDVPCPAPTGSDNTWTTRR